MKLEALLEGMALKALPRTGWVRRGVVGPESVAGHSWGIAFLVLALGPAGLDRGKMLAYAALHDLPEVRVGDLTPADDVRGKAERERAAFVAMFGERADLIALYDAYEARGDAEARFVAELDKVDMALQALVYFRGGALGMAEFVESARKRVREPALVALLDGIEREMTRDR